MATRSPSARRSCPPLVGRRLGGRCRCWNADANTPTTLPLSVAPDTACRTVAGGEPLPEGLLYLLLTGEMPTEADVQELSKELASRSALGSEAEAG